MTPYLTTSLAPFELLSKKRLCAKLFIAQKHEDSVRHQLQKNKTIDDTSLSYKLIASASLREIDYTQRNSATKFLIQLF
jgi:hypothetical protein